MGVVQLGVVQLGVVQLGSVQMGVDPQHGGVGNLNKHTKPSSFGLYYSIAVLVFVVSLVEYRI